jgi:hypothetical protein
MTELPTDDCQLTLTRDEANYLSLLVVRQESAGSGQTNDSVDATDLIRALESKIEGKRLATRLMQLTFNGGHV